MRKFLAFILLLIIGVALSLSLGGCAAFDTPFNPEFVRKNPNIKTVHVSTEQEMNTLCNGPIKQDNPFHVRQRLGCALIPLFENDECVVVLYKNGPDETIEHEKRHCKYGRYHP